MTFRQAGKVFLLIQTGNCGNKLSRGYLPNQEILLNVQTALLRSANNQPPVYWVVNANIAL